MLAKMILHSVQPMDASRTTRRGSGRVDGLLDDGGPRLVCPLSSLGLSIKNPEFPRVVIALKVFEHRSIV